MTVPQKFLSARPPPFGKYLPYWNLEPCLHNSLIAAEPFATGWELRKLELKVEIKGRTKRGSRYSQLLHHDLGKACLLCVVHDAWNIQRCCRQWVKVVVTSPLHCSKNIVVFERSQNSRHFTPRNEWAPVHKNWIKQEKVVNSNFDQNASPSF